MFVCEAHESVISESAYKLLMFKHKVTEKVAFFQLRVQYIFTLLIFSVLTRSVLYVLSMSSFNSIYLLEKKKFVRIYKNIFVVPVV